MEKKNIFVAYLFWMTGGWAGLHLLYLHRDIHAFLYWCTLCGYFGLGPLRDLIYLPSYVRDVNNEPSTMEKLSEKMRKNKTPPFSVARFVGSVIVGNSWANLWLVAIPDEDIYGYNLNFLKFLAPLASAIPVWLIGNIGRETGEIKWPIIGALGTMPFMFLNYDTTNWSSVSSTIFFHLKGKRWRRTPYQNRGFCRRFTVLFIAWFIISSLWTSYIVFNAEVTYKDGERVKLKDAIKNFFTSPMFLEFKKNARKLYDDTLEKGWTKAWANMMELLDPFGEIHALKVLHLNKNATQAEISQTFKRLSKEWHPDRHKDPEAKAVAQEKFFEITDAYEKLSTIKKRRKLKNKEFEENEDDEDNYDVYHRV